MPLALLARPHFHVLLTQFKSTDKLLHIFQQQIDDQIQPMCLNIEQRGFAKMKILKLLFNNDSRTFFFKLENTFVYSNRLWDFIHHLNY